MKKIYKLLLLILIVLLMTIMLIKICIPKNINNRLNKLNLKNVNNVMFVAHPDDESLWGGDHLAKDNYLVVCVTCGAVEERKIEFENAVNEFGNIPLSLGYPDKTNNEKDNWDGCYYEIEKEIKDIINYKKWNKIITHNPEGEYGHMHHIMISTMVSLNSPKDKLYYFNKYYTKEALNDVNYCIAQISERNLEIKEYLLTNYPSQESSINDHRQNLVYEKFISYKNW